jgi:hypothetical protein
MKSLFLLIILSFYVVQLAGQVEAESAVEPTEDNRKYEQLPSFPWKLAELGPSEILPNAQLSQAFYTLTNQIDTFSFQYKWFLEGMDSTKLFVFSTKDNPHKDFRFAIKRKNDWLCLEANTLQYLNLNIAKCEKVQLSKREDEFILFSIETPEDMQVESSHRSGVDRQLKQVKVVSLLNINTLEFYLHNVMMGYIYKYNEKQQVDGKRTVRNQQAVLQYDFLLDVENEILKISERENYISSVEIIDEELNSSEALKKGVCAPLQKTGTYKLQGNQFIFVE